MICYTSAAEWASCSRGRIVPTSGSYSSSGGPDGNQPNGIGLAQNLRHFGVERSMPGLQRLLSFATLFTHMCPSQDLYYPLQSIRRRYRAPAPRQTCLCEISVSHNCAAIASAASADVCTGTTVNELRSFQFSIHTVKRAGSSVRIS